MIRVILLGIALVLAVFAGLLVNQAMQVGRSGVPEPMPRPATEAKPADVEVLVVDRNLSIADIVTVEHLRWQAWPAIQLNPNFITRQARPDALETLAGSGARQALVAGEPVTDGKLVRPGSGGFLAAVVRRGYRAVTVRVDVASGIAGLVQPADRIDVVLTHRPAEVGDGGTADGAGMVNAAETVLEDLRVLAIDRDITTEEGRAKTPKTVTIEVTPEQAETLALATAMGDLTLSLRSAFGSDAQDGTERRFAFTRDIDVSSLVRAGRTRRPPRYLVVANDLPAGHLLSEIDLTWADSLAGVPEDRDLFIEAPELRRSLRGALLLTSLAAGEMVRPSHIMRPGDVGFAAKAIGPGMRAVSIKVEAHTAVNGFIGPGDRVDVILTDMINDDTNAFLVNQRFYGETVVADVRVLSMQTFLIEDTAGETPEVKNSATATLEVTPKQAEMVALAADMGGLTLSLRAELTDGLTPVAFGGGTSDVDPAPSYLFDLEVGAGLQQLVIQTATANAMRRQRRQPVDRIVVYRGGVAQTVKIYR